MNTEKFTSEELEYNQLMYTDDSWGVYRFTFSDKEVISEIIKTHNKFPNSTAIVIWAGEYFQKSSALFDTSDVYISLYYHDRDMEAKKEIEEKNPVLTHHWSDADDYELTKDEVEKIKNKTSEAIRIIEEIFYLEKHFATYIIGE